MKSMWLREVTDSDLEDETISCHVCQAPQPKGSTHVVVSTTFTLVRVCPACIYAAYKLVKQSGIR